MSANRLLASALLIVASQVPAQAFEGLYRGTWEYGAVTLSIENILRRPDLQKFRVNAIVRANGCLGEVTGVGYSLGNAMAIVAYDEQANPDNKCMLLLQKKGTAISIRETTGCSDHHGLTCGFGGTVTKR